MKRIDLKFNSFLQISKIYHKHEIDFQEVNPNFMSNNKRTNILRLSNKDILMKRNTFSKSKLSKFHIS